MVVHIGFGFVSLIGFVCLFVCFYLGLDRDFCLFFTCLLALVWFGLVCSVWFSFPCFSFFFG